MGILTTSSGSRRRPRRAAVTAAVAIALVSPAAPPAQAHPGPPASVFDPPAVGWDLVREVSASRFDDEVALRESRGLMVIDLEVMDRNDLIPNAAQPTDEDGVAHPRRANVFSAVFQRNTDRRATRVRRDLTRAQFRDEVHAAVGGGRRLVDMEVYASDTDPDQVRYAGVWIENREGLWSPITNVVYDVTETWLDTLLAAKREVGLIPIDVEEYSVAGCERCFSMVFAENHDHLGWSAVFGETNTTFSQYFNANGQLGYRMIAVTSQARFDGDIDLHDPCRVVPFDDCEETTARSYYGGIWVDDPDDRGWVETRNMDGATLTRRLDELTAAGFRPISFEMYKVRVGQTCWPGDDLHSDWCKNRYAIRYAVIWRQNRAGARLPTTTTTTTTTSPPLRDTVPPPSPPGTPPRHRP